MNISSQEKIPRTRRLQAAAAFKDAFLRVKEDSRLIAQACEANPWFSPVYVHRAAESLLPWLEPAALETFLSSYPESPGPPKKIAVLMAANVPFVGFQDVFLVFLSGNIPLLKYSSRDRVMMEALMKAWSEINGLGPGMYSEFSHASEVDFFVATGSDNTARHTSYLFRGLPGIIRKNRFSVAVLEGDETEADLDALTEDILLYNGMGCRSVSNVFFPQSQEPEGLISALKKYSPSMLSDSWSKRMKWETAVCEMTGGFEVVPGKILLKQSDSLQVLSPGYLNLIPYENTAQLNSTIANLREKIQCVVGRNQEVAFGQSQAPGLSDFPDGLDLIARIQEMAETT